MTDPVQLISIAVSAALVVAIVELVRRGRLTEEYSFIWIVCAVALFVLSLWRNLLDRAASILGVHYPPALLLLVLTFFVVIVSLYFSVVVSRHRKDIEKLVEDREARGRGRAARGAGTHVARRYLRRSG
jgi:hypothetical protein